MYKCVKQQKPGARRMYMPMFRDSCDQPQRYGQTQEARDLRYAGKPGMLNKIFDFSALWFFFRNAPLRFSHPFTDFPILVFANSRLFVFFPVCDFFELHTLLAFFSKLCVLLCFVHSNSCFCEIHIFFEHSFLQCVSFECDHVVSQVCWKYRRVRPTYVEVVVSGKNMLIFDWLFFATPLMATKVGGTNCCSSESYIIP